MTDMNVTDTFEHNNENDKLLEDLENIWKMVYVGLEQRMAKENMSLWFAPLQVVGFDGDTITMSTANTLKKNTIDKHFMTDLTEGFAQVLGFPVTINITVREKTEEEKNYTDSIPIFNPNSSVAVLHREAMERRALEEQKAKLEPVYRFPGDTGYIDTNHYVDSNEECIPFRHEGEGSLEVPNPADFKFEYTFDNFIVGSTNKFAHAACLAVANHPADRYNPLFVYGNSGLGKTHLLYATINQLRLNNPSTRIIYTKGEDFTNQMIASLATKTMDDFREKYRKCDVLLIDDIQFIAGKQSTQEEFFHTFNALFEQGKQIILTSDRPPRDIQTLEDRLKTRFEWGLLADIEPPDAELRSAILKAKAEQIGVVIPDNVLHYLSENLRFNVRQIEGAIKKLSASSLINDTPITLDMARDCIAVFLGGEQSVNVTVDRIFTAVEGKYGVSREEMKSAKRNKEIAMPRHIVIYLIREMTGMSLPAIGKMFERDHTTVMSSYNNVDARVRAGGAFTSEIADLKEEILTS